MTHAVVIALLVAGTNLALSLVAMRSARTCGVTLDLRNPRALAMLCAGSAWEVSIVVSQGNHLQTLALIPALSSVFVSAATDAASGYIFDTVSFSTLVATLALSAYVHLLPYALFGALTGAAALGALHLLTAGKGLGLGDVKLACCIGAGFGVRGTLAVLGIAFVSGGLYGAFLLITRRARCGRELYFAPYLAAGVIGTALWGLAT